MNSDIIKPKKFGHLHLVYHFTVPLKKIFESLLGNSQGYLSIYPTLVGQIILYLLSMELTCDAKQGCC